MKQQLCCNRTTCISFNSFVLQITYYYHFPIVCGLWDNGGCFVCMYEFMHICMYISVFMYVEVHAYICIRLASDSFNVKRKQNSRFVVRKISTFYLEAR